PIYRGTGAVVSHVGADGGTASRLYFAVVGDTRPAGRDDVAGYPSAVISQIYERLAALEPPPSFVVSTGDYQFASSGGSGESARAQLALYASARSQYPGPLFPAMGNHECTGATASNCGQGNAEGVTAPLRAFEDTLLAPIGKPLYFEVDVVAPGGAWSAKVLVLAANAWDARQAAWLDGAMARPTTYTFVVRHEPASAATAPGVMPSEDIMARHAYTLAICGHSHTYDRPREREIVVGNGGAPLTGSKSYGFAVIDQQPDGTLAVDMIDYVSGRADPSFRFVVSP
ncbi:MAG: metallophosphoesterase family protein, partial [Polyangiaceae bacterium]